MNFVQQPKQNSIYMVIVLLIFICTSNASGAAGEESSGECERKYGLLQRVGNLGNSIEQYGKEVWLTRGARIVLRPETPADIARDHRWLGFLAEQYPHEKTWYQQAWRKIQSVLPETKLTPKPTPIDPNIRRYRFGIIHGIEYNLDRLPRTISNGLKENGISIRGVSDSQKVFTLPVTFAIAGLTPLGTLYSLDLNLLEAMMERWKEHQDWKRARHLLQAGDYRFNDVYLNYKKAMGEREAMIRRGAPKTEVKAFEDKILEENIKMLENEESLYKDFFDTEQFFSEQYQDLEKQNAPATAYHELDKTRIEELLKNPLLADIPKRLHIPISQISSPTNFDLVNSVVTLREDLFQRYSLIPNLVAGGAQRDKILNDPQWREDVAAITASPVYRVLQRLQQQGKIDSDTMSRYLMEDSFWQLNQFATWKAQGITPMQIGGDGKPSNKPLSISDIYNEMLQELWKEKKLPGDYNLYLQ